MQHDHLNFYSNSAQNNNGIQQTQSITLGGFELTPGLIGETEIVLGGPTKFDANRSTVEKHVQIVEYLKTIPKTSRATFIDIQRELNINLSEDHYVLGMLKSNPKIDQEVVNNEVSFQFRPKFNINNKKELQYAIIRAKNGIVLNDILGSYEGIEADCNAMIVGGEIVANKNSYGCVKEQTLVMFVLHCDLSMEYLSNLSMEFKSLVLYPRGMPFLVHLSGTVTATQGQQLISTSTDLRKEIRRGEAIQVDSVWYRISSAIGSGAANQQNQRSTAPTSVTSDRELSDKNVYCDVYTENKLPLDGDFEGSTTATATEQQTMEGNNGVVPAAVYKGVALKHGCTNDVKKAWENTYNQPEFQKIRGDDDALERELITLKLITPVGISAAQAAANKRKLNQSTGVKKRQVRKPRMSSTAGIGANSNTNYGVNAHLRGSGLEKVLMQTREAENKKLMQK